VGASAAGLAGLLAFHTSPSSVSLGLIPGAPARSLLGHSSGGNVLPESGSGQRIGSGSTRAAVGPAVNYNYGVLSVRVTVSGHRLVKISIATLKDAALSRSQLIDHQSIPILESEALRAQSANIQGMSGASYTSAGFAQSLQGALHALGFS
jgi:FMN-binding domain